MKKALLFSFFIFHSLFSFSQSWDWGKDATGSLKSNDNGSPVAIDGAGNAYITGQYGISVDFGNITLTGSSGDIVYLAKYDPSGNVLWAVQADDSNVLSSSFGTSVTLDHLGNVYITGFFYDTLVFGNDTLRADLFAPSVFIAKYTTSGNIVWAKQAVIPSYNSYSINQSFSVTTDQSNDILITGTFQDSITFGSHTLTIRDSVGSAVFLVKYDPSGNVLWARQSVPGIIGSSTGTGTSVITDNRNNIYITGHFSDSISFGSHTLVNYAFTGFIAKYSATGNIVWAKQSQNSGGVSPASITRDGKPNLYIAGYFSDSVKFGPYTLHSSPAHAGEYTAFLTKYDTNGNVIWAKESSPGMEATSMSEDGAGDIYMAGLTGNTNSYHFGGFALQALHAQDTENAFLLKFDTAGTAVCGSVIDNLWYYNQSPCVAANYINASTSYIYMAGTFGDNETIVCGPDTLAPVLAGANIFVGRWLECPIDAGVSEMKAESGEVKVYPNPGNGIFTLSCHSESGIADEESNLILEIYNVMGQPVLTETLRSAQGDGSNNINLSSQPNGIYLYRVIAENGDLIGQGKIIIAK